MKINIPNEALNVINVLKKSGYQAYIVGGYIRDTLLHKVSYDIDINTNATPKQVKEILKEYRVNDTFEKYGCIKFKINEYQIEITTFRKEYEYINHRKPSKIEFIEDLHEDLKRRDFTINALCFDGEKFVDLFNGLEDLNKKNIKMIGDPIKRFEEDAVRILRALRFCCKLGFDLDEEIQIAIKEKSHLLNSLNNSVKAREIEGIIKGSYYREMSTKYKELFGLCRIRRDIDGIFI